ncbi:MAG: FAD-binding oxidoreductase [Actinomycetota bacterium]
MTATGFDTIVVGNGLIGSAAARHLTDWGLTVALIGPGEPADPATHTGVFASHYDQGRLCGRSSADPIWGPINRLAIDAYPELQTRSGIDFHRGVGWLRAARLGDGERAELVEWVERAQREHGITIRHHEPGDRSWKAAAPMLDYPASHDVIVEPAPAGYLNPRQLLTAQNGIARSNGATVVDRLVVEILAGVDGVTVTTDDGTRFDADRVLVACGAFTNTDGLLPQPVPLRVKTESTIWAAVTPAEAERLQSMPVTSYDIEHQTIDDLYVAPPIRYPDGVHRIKLGGNTASEAWPADLDEVKHWFRSGANPEQAAMEEALRTLLPGVAIDDVTSHRCIVTYTPSTVPIIDAAPGDEHGRTFVATGGNGGGAQGSDTLGLLAAGLVTDGRWIDGIDRDPFRATSHWGDGRAARSKAQARAATESSGRRRQGSG